MRAFNRRVLFNALVDTAPSDNEEDTRLTVNLPDRVSSVWRRSLCGSVQSPLIGVRTPPGSQHAGPTTRQTEREKQVLLWGALGMWGCQDALSSARWALLSLVCPVLEPVLLALLLPRCSTMVLTLALAWHPALLSRIVHSVSQLHS